MPYAEQTQGVPVRIRTFINILLGHFLFMFGAILGLTYGRAKQRELVGVPSA